ncbi:MAG: cupin domain-containing protein [Chloroflexi bacterium]|nr:cupin domain-containing protein [Chloroflexota bacterium]
MAWKKIDVEHLPSREHSGGKRIMYSSDTFHMWLHTDPVGVLRGRVENEAQELHKHFADEMFFCLQGELTIRFADPEGEEVIPAGAFVVVPAGQLYSLENTGSETMILLGSRAEAHDAPRMGDEGEPIQRGTHVWAVEQTEMEQAIGAAHERWSAGRDA